MTKSFKKYLGGWKIFFISITAILLFIFLLEFKIVGQAVYGDGRYYLAFTRSIYFSQNVDISDEMNHYWSPESNNKPAGFTPVPKLQGKIGETTYNFSLGSSIIWLPFYTAADTIVITLSAFGLPFIRNGYSDIYQIVLGFGNIFFVISGLFILSRLMLRRYQTRIVALSLILIVFATNLLYYGSLDVVNSHPFSFFGSSLLIYLFFQYKGKTNFKNIFLQGIVLGLMTSNRTQDVVFILIPFASILANTELKKRKLPDQTRLIILFLLGLFLGYLPELIILSFGQGKLFLTPHLIKASSDFYPLAHTLGVLFDRKLGLFYYMPILLIAFAGLFLYHRRLKLFGGVFIAISLANFLLISSYDGWNTAGYTIRYFISSLPLLAFGLAEIILYLKKKFSYLPIYSISLLFILHQLVAIAVFKLLFQDPTYVGSQLSQSGQLKILILQTLNQALSNF
ncbi:MAG: hypothetical protein HY426_05075 [Candidatus Levybacteria bacterium]|nr:hypothetical protein [Candidatus Levybacteria bacterium]